jgi:hypothetical protein
MSKFYFECTICPIIKQNIINYISDTKKVFAPGFVKQNYHKHLGYSVVLTFFAIWFLFEFAHLQDTGIFFQLFLGGFGAYGVNWVREWFYGKFYGAPWDDTDVNMGSYGGIVGTAIFLATIAQLIY